jgi:two-component system nitrate/nitrite response regulator NarL
MRPVMTAAILKNVPVRCLLVDDDAHFLAAAGRLLRREGAEVVGFASTGEEALERARSLRPDVVLVDIGLQGESGFDVAERLANVGEPPPPVILISSYGERDFRDLILSSSALGFVSKSELSVRAIELLVGADGQPKD